MSLVIATYVPEGIIMASDSRQSLTIEGQNPDGSPFKVETINSDNVTKTFLLEKQGVGISSFGQDLLGGVPMASHIKRFSEAVLQKDDGVEAIAKKLSEFISSEFGKPDTGFHVCGYKKEGKTSVPHVWFVHVKQDKLERRNLKPGTSDLAYGATWSGQADVLIGLINPVVIEQNGQTKVVKSVAPIIWDAMSLQDAIDFSTYAIRLTIDTMRFQARPKSVGGSIDVLLISPYEHKWIQNKELHGT